MKVKKAELLITAGRKDQYPDTDVVEIAFAGKSNVGKSSLINSLVNRKKLARTSSAPGKTQTVNFYSVNDEFNFVDLPGYGYAKVSKKERENWAKMINIYLNERETLTEVVLLVDCRHEPSENDKMMYNWIRSFGFSGYVIATKCDKLSKNQLAKNINLIKKTLQIPDKEFIVPFSSLKKTNLDKVWDLIENKILEINQ